MPARAPLTPDLIDQSIARSMDRVFTTMLKASIKLVERTASLNPSVLGPGNQTIGCVGFVGDINGVLHLRFSDEFAAIATGLVLGMTPTEIRLEGPEVIKDTIGELTNMSVGCFKNTFCDSGYPCMLTLPTIIRGEQLAAPAIKGTTRHVYYFESAGHPVIADLQMKQE
ncbi:MAG TPA: chemotaxis protein CheX [Rariglobus sp.]|jgi:chemotaxis protein CheX